MEGFIDGHYVLFNDYKDALSSLQAKHDRLKAALDDLYGQVMQGLEVNEAFENLRNSPSVAHALKIARQALADEVTDECTRRKT